MSEALIRDLFLALNSEKIAYAVLRGYEGLPRTIGNDIDMGVSAEELDKFLELLCTCASKHGYEHRVDLYRQGVLKLYLLNSSGKAVKVDVWWAFKYCGLEYIDIDRLLRSRQYYGNLFFVPKSENEVALSFLKELLHMRRVRPDKAPALRAKQNAHFGEPFEPFFRPALISRFHKAINEDIEARQLLSLLALLELAFTNVRAYGISLVCRSVVESIGIRFFGRGSGRALLAKDLSS